MGGTVFNIKRYSIHDGPGIRTTVFLKGCPLRCIWCHNPEGIQSEPAFFFDPKICLNCSNCVRSCSLGCIKKKEDTIEIQLDCCAHCDACVKACPTNALSKNGVCYSSDELMEIVKKDIPFFDESDGGVTFSGGEPLFQFEFLNEMLIKCKSQGIHTVLDTSGLAPLEKIDAIKEHTDLFLYDIKFVNEDEHIQYTGVSNILILKNLRFLISENIPLWIRIPIIPGINNTQENISLIMEMLREYGFTGRVHLLAYHDLSSVKQQKMVEKTSKKIMDPGIHKNNRCLEIERIKEIFQTQGFEVKIGG